MTVENLEDIIDITLLTLTPRENRVISLRFGLDDGRKRTLVEVGREFNLSGERIRQIRDKSLAKLRRSKKVKNSLRDYLGEI